MGVLESVVRRMWCGCTGVLCRGCGVGVLESVVRSMWCGCTGVL